MTKPFTLYPYQRRAVEFIEKRNYLAGLFAEMGTGKTPIVLSVLARARAKRILIVCPLSATNVWRREIIKVGAPWDVLVLNRGTLEKRAERLERWLKHDSGRVRCVIVNFDVYWRHPDEYKTIKGRSVHFPLRALRKAILKFEPEAVIPDEAHRLQSHTTKQSKFAFQLAEKAHIRIAPTGSPISNGIEDLFSIYRFIDPRVFGTSHAKFERRFIIRGGYSGFQILGYRNEHEVKRKLDLTAFQISQDEALDLPGRVSQVVPVDLEPKARAAYERMRKESLVELEALGKDGKPVSGKAIASIVLTTLTRLQQIAGGSVPIAIRPSQGAPETRIAEVGSEKIRACVELVEQALGNKRRVVVFARFRDEIRRLTGAFPHHYRDTEGRCFYCHKPIRAALHLKPSKDSYVGVIMGGVDADKRDELITRLNSGSVKVLIIQIQAGSESVDLTAASVAIFFSTGYSLREFLQARGRIYRHGQKQRVNEYFLQVKRSIDEPIFKALNNKQSIARKVTRLGYAKSLISGRRK